jgi:hypothetical protein
MRGTGFILFAIAVFNFSLEASATSPRLCNYLLQGTIPQIDHYNDTLGYWNRLRAVQVEALINSSFRDAVRSYKIAYDQFFSIKNIDSPAYKKALSSLEQSQDGLMKSLDHPALGLDIELEQYATQRNWHPRELSSHRNYIAEKLYSIRSGLIADVHKLLVEHSGDAFLTAPLPALEQADVMRSWDQWLSSPKTPLRVKEELIDLYEEPKNIKKRMIKLVQESEINPMAVVIEKYTWRVTKGKERYDAKLIERFRKAAAEQDADIADKIIKNQEELHK